MIEKIAPFVSNAQRKWMYENKPEMAKEWQSKTPKGKKLPEHVKKASDELSLAFSKIAHLVIKKPSNSQKV